jgi:hypothetical protein
MLRERAVVSAISWCVRAAELWQPQPPPGPLSVGSALALRRVGGQIFGTAEHDSIEPRLQLHPSPILSLSPFSVAPFVCSRFFLYPVVHFLAGCSCFRRSLPSPPTRLDSEGAAIRFAVRTKSRARRVDSLLLANSSRYGSALSERERCGGAVRKQRPSVYTYATHSEAHTS